MDMEAFLQRQNGFHESFLNGLLRKMPECRPEVETIIAGVDTSGAHLYKVDFEGEIVSSDAVGFAAIGAGGRHAEPQFMFANHATWNDFPESLLLAYSAKRRAEIAPGVGAETDVCVISGLGGWRWLTYDNMQYVKEIYSGIQERNTETITAANERIATDFAQVALAARAKMEPAKATEQDTPPPPAPPPPSKPPELKAAPPPEDPGG